MPIHRGVIGGWDVPTSAFSLAPQEGLLRPLPGCFRDIDIEELRAAVHILEALVVNHGEDLEEIADQAEESAMPGSASLLDPSGSTLDRAVSICLRLAAHQLEGSPETPETFAVVRVEEFRGRHGANIRSRLHIFPMPFEARWDPDKVRSTYFRAIRLPLLRTTLLSLRLTEV